MQNVSFVGLLLLKSSSTSSSNDARRMILVFIVMIVRLSLDKLKRSFFAFVFLLFSTQFIILFIQHELLLVAEIIKILYSAWMISDHFNSAQQSSSSSSSMSVPEGGDDANQNNNNNNDNKPLSNRLMYLITTSRKMLVLALIYGCMNIISFVSLRNISAGMFTIFAQCKILTTATFSTIILKRVYSWTQWRALLALLLGVLLFSEPIWGNSSSSGSSVDGGNVVLGTTAVLVEVTLSGFASIYFEKVIKSDPLQLGIWERNFQLAFWSVPVYIVFIVGGGGGTMGFFGGWSFLALFLAVLGAAGGLLVALSIKYGDSILKTLATTGAIVLTGLLDHFLLGGPLTPIMMIAGVQVIIAICNYTFDGTPPPTTTLRTGGNTNNNTDTTTTSLKPNVAPLDDDNNDDDDHKSEMRSTDEMDNLLRRKS